MKIGHKLYDALLSFPGFVYFLYLEREYIADLEREYIADTINSR